MDSFLSVLTSRCKDLNQLCWWNQVIWWFSKTSNQ